MDRNYFTLDAIKSHRILLICSLLIKAIGDKVFTSCVAKKNKVDRVVKNLYNIFLKLRKERKLFKQSDLS